MSRIRRFVVLGAVLVVVLIGGAFAAFALRGGDAPAPTDALRGRGGGDRRRPGRPPTTRSPRATTGSSATACVRVHRVRSVKGAVGRTPDVSGTATVESDAITAADLGADLTTLTSDDGRRDNALRDRGLEAPSSRTRGSCSPSRSGSHARGPPRAAASPSTARRSRSMSARLTQRVGEEIELVGSAPIKFARLGIDPPSVAGFVTVEDEVAPSSSYRLAPR